MDRKRFLVGSAGLSATVLYGPFVAAGGAATTAVTDDDLAFANFGVSAEFLLKDVSSVGQQIGALSALWAPVGAKSFPVATDVETASAAIESYLG